MTGSAFGYGTLTVEAAGGRDLRFRRTNDPQSVQAAIVNCIHDADEDVPGSTAQ